MEKEEQLMEVERERVQLIGKKLRRGVLFGRREGNTTPSPTWKFGLVQPDGTLIQEFDFASNSNTISARKLGANLWEMQPQIDATVAKMSKIGPILGNQKGGNVLSKVLNEPPAGNPAEQPASSINLGKQAAKSATQHNVRVKKLGQLQQPLSPASSMEVPLHRPAVSPRSFLACKGKYGEASHSVKTSTELLKMLNKIWSLEEKHALDMSLVKMLRRELDESQARIQELLKEKKRDQAEINKLTKWITEYKVGRRKEQDRFKDAVKLLEDKVEDKVEDEIKLRRNSEKRHHKLGEELLDLKSLFSNALRELERERKARTLLEDLCDEFAKGIRDYEQEVRSVKHEYCKNKIGRECNGRLILHISEAWLDERVQRKLAGAHDISAKQSDLDKLCFDIEGFLRANQSGYSGNNDYSPAKNQCERDVLGNSMESVHSKYPASALLKVNDDDASQLHSMAILKQTKGFFRQQGESTSDGYDKEKAKSRMVAKKVQSRNDSDPSNSHMQLEETVNEKPHLTVNEAEESARIPGKGELMQGYPWEGMNQTDDIDADLHNRMTKHLSFTPDDQKHRHKNHRRGGSFDPSIFSGAPSPVKKWISNVPAIDHDISEASSRWPGSIKPDTLKAKLIEARQESQQSNARTPKVRS